MKNFVQLFLIFLFAVTFVSCETDVDLFSEPEDVAVVYALLDPGAEVQYFRINPTFIGDGDARELAGDTSLTNYNTGVLDVRLYTLKDENSPFIQAEETSDIKLEPGGIFDPNIRMYKINSPLKDSIRFGDTTKVNTIIKPNEKYRLWIKNNVSGKIYYSDIEVGDISQLNVLLPVPGFRRQSCFLNFHSGTDYVPYEFKFSTIDGADRYRLQMIYYHWTKDSLNPDSTVYNIGEAVSQPGDASVAFQFMGEDFYKVLNTKVGPYDISVGRTGDRAKLVITAMGTDLNEYIEVENITSSGLSQERPEYSNIENGLGVFSFKVTKNFVVFVNDDTGDELRNGPYTFDRFSCNLFGSVGDSRGKTLCN